MQTEHECFSEESLLGLKRNLILAFSSDSTLKTTETCRGDETQNTENLTEK